MKYLCTRMVSCNWRGRWDNINWPSQRNCLTVISLWELFKFWHQIHYKQRYTTIRNNKVNISEGNIRGECTQKKSYFKICQLINMRFIYATCWQTSANKWKSYFSGHILIEKYFIFLYLICFLIEWIEEFKIGKV